MIAIAYYLLKVIICSGILFLYYHVALRNKIFHQWNRFYLLAAVVLSLLLPWLQFTFIHYQQDANSAIELLRVVQSADDYMEEIYISQHQAITMEQWLGLAYLAVSVIVLSTVIVSVAKIYFIIKAHRVQLVNKIKFIATQEQGTPFSFFRYIFWNDKIDIHSFTGQQIFQHELVHVKEAHTFDKLFLQLTLILFWCNPFFWLIRRELQMIHEFIADKKAVQQHDTATLAAMILQASYPHQFSNITNPFFQSSIKRRLLMLTKIQNPRISYASRILALPLIAFTVLAFSFRTKNAPVINLENPITVVIDAGHGKTASGNMSGARQDGIYEDAIVLALAKKIKEANANTKINIVLTRTSDAIVDLHKRVDIAKEKNADLFISLHLAASETGTDGSGMEVYVSNKNTPYQQQSELLGSAVKEELNSIYPTNPDLIKRKVGIWVIDQNSCPSILVECGYITNQKDRNFITNEANQKRIAEKILSAIERYAASSNQSSVLAALTDTLPNRNANDINKIDINKQKNSITITYKDGSTESLAGGKIQGNDKAGAGNTGNLGKKPLYIVDGKEFYGNLNTLRPENIESINILKDQSAIARYGKKAKDGAIEIHTKAKMERTITGVMVKKEKDKPLYFVDGKEFEANPNKLNPNNIQSINVLKGQSAIAKYGDRGKNGVIEIQTKSVGTESVDTVPKKTPVFSKTEVEASIDMKEWREFLGKNLQSVIESAASNGMPTGQYTVNLRFIVKKDGSITDFKALNDPGYGLAQKVLEIMSKSPKWNPGKQNGKPVNSYHTQPITFVISDGSDSKEQKANPANTAPAAGRP